MHWSNFHDHPSTLVVQAVLVMNNVLIARAPRDASFEALPYPSPFSSIQVLVGYRRPGECVEHIVLEVEQWIGRAHRQDAFGEMVCVSESE